MHIIYFLTIYNIIRLTNSFLIKKKGFTDIKYLTTEYNYKNRICKVHNIKNKDQNK